jgi:hypothetical protein
VGASCYVCWVKECGRWRAVALGPTLKLADMPLMKWIAGQRRPPVASKVLPRGTRPGSGKNGK